VVCNPPESIAIRVGEGTSVKPAAGHKGNEGFLSPRLPMTWVEEDSWEDGRRYQDELGEAKNVGGTLVRSTKKITISKILKHGSG